MTSTAVATSTITQAADFEPQLAISTGPSMASSGMEVVAPSPADELADIAAQGGIQRVHFVAWRDMGDLEGGGSSCTPT